jgi:hypothetical protein
MTSIKSETPRGRERRLPPAELRPDYAVRRYVGRTETWPGEDIARALIDKFCKSVWLEDEADFAALAGRPFLFLANHQVTVESILFVLAVSPLLGEVPIQSIAKIEHRASWLGQLLGHLYAYPGNIDPECVLFVPQGDGRALLELMVRATRVIEAKRCGLLVHAAGSRMLSCRDPMRIMSTAFIDLAISRGYPVVPLKFHGGLPVESLENFIDFPVGYGGQDYMIGRSIAPDALAAIPAADRRQWMLDRINNLGGPIAAEHEYPPDRAFKADMRGYLTRYGILEPASATILAALKRRHGLSPEMAAMLQGVDDGRLTCPATPEGQWLANLARWLTEDHMPVTVG